MTSKKSIGIVALGLVVALSPQWMHAQFGGLFGGGPNVETIATDDLSNLLTEQRQAEAKAVQAGTAAPKPDFVVVDVRSEAEINVSIIPGAITQAEFEKNRQQYQGRTVIPYCTVGGRSGAYAKRLAKDGVAVKNYQGSILEWVGAELPLVTLDGKSTNRVHTYSDRYRIPAKYQQVTE